MPAFSCVTTVKRIFQNCELRFDDGVMESAFKTSVERDLMKYCFVGMFVGVILGTWAAVVAIPQLMQQSDFSATHGLGVKLLVDCAGFTFITVSATLSLSKFRWGFPQSMDCELFVMSVVIGLCCLNVVLRPWNTYVLCGAPCNEKYSVLDMPHSELNVIIRQLLIIVPTSMFLPIRSHRSWILSLWGIASYCLAVYTLGSPFGMSTVPSTVVALFVLFSYAFVGGWKSERHARQTWVAKDQVIERQCKLDRQHVAVSRILGSLCESLLHLGSSFEILEDCQRFRAMLLDTSRSSIKGACFSDSISTEEGRKTFEEALQAGCFEAEDDALLPPGSMIHVSLRDTSNRVFTVYAYHTCFRNLQNQARYVVGLVESSEQLPVQANISSQISNNLQNANPQRPAPLGLSSNSSNSAGSSSGSSLFDFAQADVLAISAQTVIRATSAFKKIFGMETINSLHDILSPQMLSTFTSWLEQTVESMREGTFALPHVQIFDPFEVQSLRTNRLTFVKMQVFLPKPVTSDSEGLRDMLARGQYAFSVRLETMKRETRRLARAQRNTQGTPATCGARGLLGIVGDAEHMLSL